MHVIYIVIITQLTILIFINMILNSTKINYAGVFNSVCLALLLSCSLCQCKDDNEGEIQEEKQEKEEESAQLSLDEYIGNLQDPVQISVNGAGKKEQIGDVLTEVDDETKTYCECTKYKQTASFSDLFILDPSVSAIYPGNIIEGNSAADGSYRSISIDRAPLTISTDFMNIDDSISRTVSNPTLSNINQAIKEIMYDAGINGGTGAECTFEITEINTEEELELAIGASFSYSKLKLKENFDFSKHSKTSKFLLKFQQVYFTIGVDVPSSPSKFFADYVTAEDLRKALGGTGVVPVYVSNVRYGRSAYFCIESEESSDSVRNTLETSFKSGAINLAVDEKNVRSSKLDSYKISGTVIGGSAQDAAGTIQGKDAMLDFIKNNGDFNKGTPGKPIAYTLSRLSDNSTFSVNSSKEYVVRKCKSTNALIVPKSFYGIKGENDVCGTIKAKIQYSDGESTQWFYIFNTPVTKDGYTSVPIGKSVDVPPSEDNNFDIDYDRYEGAKLIVDAQLYEWDAPCGCGNRHEYDKYEPFYAEYQLSDIIDKGNGEIEIIIKLTEEWTESHHYRGLFNNTLSHDPGTSRTDCQVKFTFTVNIQ